MSQEPPPDPEWDNLPPEDQQAARAAERALLGTLLANPDLADKILPAIDPADFAAPVHETIWNAATILRERDQIPDIPALLDFLTGDRIFTQAGGGRHLADLLTDAPTYIQPDQHAEIVRKGTVFRRADTLLATLRTARRASDETKLRDTLEKLGDLAHEGAATFGPTNGHRPTGLHDLSWILTGQPPEPIPPTYVVRTDGTALFYRGRVNGLFGDPESGKTWIAQIGIIEALQRGERAAMIDVDHNGADHTAARLLLLGARPEHLADPDRYRYYEPEDADELRNAVAELTAWRPAYVLLDSLGEMLPMLGAGSNDNDEISAALRTLCLPLARTNACVVHVDHLPKSHEARATGFAIGGTAKKRATDGGYIRVQSVTKPTPGGIGRSSLYIEKDRTGELRKTSGGGFAGTLTIDSTQPHITTTRIGQEGSPMTPDGKFRPTIIMEQISKFLEHNDQATGRDITSNIAGKNTTINTALQLLIEGGWVARTKGARGAWIHHLNSVYDPMEDDQANPETQPGWGQPRTDPDDPALWGQEQRP